MILYPLMFVGHFIKRNKKAYQEIAMNYIYSPSSYYNTHSFIHSVTIDKMINNFNSSECETI